MKRYDGSAWKNAPTYRYDGGNWVGHPFRRYDGANWVDAVLNGSSLVGYWDFESDSISSGTVTDRSGSGNDMTLNGSPTTGVAGIVGDGISMDGTDDEGVISLSSSLTDWTVAFWFKPADLSSRQKIFANKTNVPEIRHNPGTPPKLQIQYGNGWTAIYPDGWDLREGEWTHVMFDSAGSVWIDGNLSLTTLSSGPNLADGTDNKIVVGRGQDGFEKWFSGDLDELRLWNTTIGGDVPENAYRHGRVVPAAEFVGYPDLIDVTDTSDPAVDYVSGDPEPYKLSVYDQSAGVNEFYTSPDLDTWNQQTDNLLPASGPTVQDYVYDSGGTLHVYTSIADSDTGHHSGSDWLSLGSETIALSGGADCGAYFENGTYYLFVEADLVSGEPTGNKIDLYTSGSPASGFSRVGTMIDVNNKSWSTGDVDVELIDGSYYMFMDRNDGHPTYHTALAKSDSLDSGWTIISEQMNTKQGGDMDVLEINNTIHGFTEYTGWSESGVGQWEIHLDRLNIEA